MRVSLQQIARTRGTQAMAWAAHLPKVQQAKRTRVSTRCGQVSSLLPALLTYHYVHTSRADRLKCLLADPILLFSSSGRAAGHDQ